MNTTEEENIKLRLVLLIEWKNLSAIFENLLTRKNDYGNLLIEEKVKNGFKTYSDFAGGVAEKKKLEIAGVKLVAESNNETFRTLDTVI